MRGMKKAGARQRSLEVQPESPGVRLKLKPYEKSDENTSQIREIKQRHRKEQALGCAWHALLRRRMGDAKRAMQTDRQLTPSVGSLSSTLRAFRASGSATEMARRRKFFCQLKHGEFGVEFP